MKFPSPTTTAWCLSPATRFCWDNFAAAHCALSQLVQRGLLHQIKVLRGALRLYEQDYRFNLGEKPFGEVRIVLSSGLLLADIKAGLFRAGTIVLVALVISTLLAVVVSRAALAPIANISAQLDRISAGQYDAPGPNDARALATAATNWGR